MEKGRKGKKSQLKSKIQQWFALVCYKLLQFLKGPKTCQTTCSVLHIYGLGFIMYYLFFIIINNLHFNVACLSTDLPEMVVRSSQYKLLLYANRWTYKMASVSLCPLILMFNI